MLNLTFADNTARGGAGSPALRAPWIPGGNGGSAFGGAVCSEGTTSVTNCTFYGNQAISGAGASPYQGVPGGSLGQSFGGAMAGAGGTTTLAFCTLASNSATNGSAVQFDGYGLFQLTHTILSGPPSGDNASGPINDLGYNLSSDSSLVLTNSGSAEGINPLLGPLADNGGPTPTLAPLPGSPAIDAGASHFAVTTDQRGLPRPSGLRNDIGAFEVQDGFRLLSITRVGQQGLRLRGNGPVGAAFRLLASEDLSSWASTGSGTVGLDGLFEIDVPATTAGKRFFRTVTP